eukprot:TRINITY_DN42952_c0_g3_i1.p1 TRINITY_DN42952_c0_g3~~TRINITY_DN42952_c0_g3_i1.p1  ORF type:complete len:184 (-),score=13.05 TRINITY_DN42952_c0_g3_i1:121-672(-)
MPAVTKISNAIPQEASVDEAAEFCSEAPMRRSVNDSLTVGCSMPAVMTLAYATVAQLMIELMLAVRVPRVCSTTATAQRTHQRSGARLKRFPGRTRADTRRFTNSNIVKECLGGCQELQGRHRSVLEGSMWIGEIAFCRLPGPARQKKGLLSGACRQRIIFWCFAEQVHPVYSTTGAAHVWLT